MDSNGTGFVLLNSKQEFRTASRDCGWNETAAAFMLKRTDQPQLPHLNPTHALELWRDATPYILDDHGQIGRLSQDRLRFEWSLSWPGTDWQSVRAGVDVEVAAGENAAAVTLDSVDAPAGTRFTDLHLGGSALVALPYSDDAANHGLLLVHLRRRWQAHCALPFAPVRAWVDGEDRIWVAGDSFIGLCRGAPLPQPYYPRADRFEPVQINPDPVRLLWHTDLPANAGLIATAASDETLMLLVQDDATSNRQRLITRPLSASASAAFTQYLLPAKLPLATDISCISSHQVLMLPPFEEGAERGSVRDCPLLRLTTNRNGSAIVKLEAERWPRRSEASVRFVRHRDNGVRTLTNEGVTPLYRLAQARFASQASAILTLPLDSAAPGNIWHRLYLEACIPPGCRLRVAAQTSELQQDWSLNWEQQPDPSWLPIASELPFASGSLTPVPQREGLFEVLLQRQNGAVRELAGRYMRLRLTLSGDGRHTPAIFAIRAWYPRFSWQTNYLPGHFHQQQAAALSTPKEPQAANAADLRERLMACFEGMLTPIEDRIAAAETLLYPDATPTPFLPWLAQMNGTRLPTHWPAQRQRKWVAQQGQLQRQHGAFGGLCQALDIITDGAVGRGEVVPVELFRLRRTLATVLGISMDDAQHPLTLGTGQSGNSIIGESLILSDDHAREFLALFAPEVASNPSDRQTVEHFFDQYARRLTVVLHGAARSLRQVVTEAMPGLVPAVVQWSLLETDHPFVLGLSPLLRIDTFLERQPAPGRVQLNRTILGRNHILQNPVALSPEHAQPLATESQANNAIHYQTGYQVGDRP